jgi:hypothetical protein
MADVADKIMRSLTDETRKMRELAAMNRDARQQAEVSAQGTDTKTSDVVTKP